MTEKPLLAREISRSDTWQVSQFVTAPAATTGEITAKAWILNTLQQAEATVPVSVTSSPPPAQLGALGSLPDALQVGIETPVHFNIPVSGSSLPASLTLEQENTNGQWQPVMKPGKVTGTLTDSGANGDIQAGDGIYGGTATFTPLSEGTLVFRASSLPQTQAPPTPSRCSPFPIGAAPTDFQKVIATSSGQKVVGNRLLVRFRPGTESDTISAILNTINGTPKGFLGAIKYYHVEIPTADQATLFAALLALRASPMSLLHSLILWEMVLRSPMTRDMYSSPSNPPQIDWAASDPGSGA